MTDAERLVLTLTADLVLMADGYTALAEIEAKSQELRKALAAMQTKQRVVANKLPASAGERAPKDLGRPTDV